MDVSYSEVRQNLRKMIDSAASSHEPTYITSHKKRTAVLLSYDDYCSLEETAYLLKSPENATRLLRAVTDFKQGKNFDRHNLVDDEA